MAAAAAAAVVGSGGLPSAPVSPVSPDHPSQARRPPPSHVSAPGHIHWLPSTRARHAILPCHPDSRLPAPGCLSASVPGSGMHRYAMFRRVPIVSTPIVRSDSLRGVAPGHPPPRPPGTLRHSATTSGHSGSHCAQESLVSSS